MVEILDAHVHQQCAAEPWFRKTGSKVKFGAVPERFEAMAEAFKASPEQAAGFKAYAELARDLYRRQIRDTLDPAQVAALCAKEPWSFAPAVERIGECDFGYVYERFRRARTLFEGTAEYDLYNKGFEEAGLIYVGQVHALSRAFAAGKTRMKVEPVNAQLFAMAHRFEGDGTNRYGWLLRICELNGEYMRAGARPGSAEARSGPAPFADEGASHQPPRNDGAQQMVLRTVQQDIPHNPGGTRSGGAAPGTPGPG